MAGKRTTKTTSKRRAKERDEPLPKPQHEAYTAAKKQRFLDAYADLGTITHAANAAGICTQTHYNALAADEEYAAAFDKARQRFADKLEREVYRRAVEGWDEPVFQRGELVGHIRKFSDRMLELGIKRHRTEFKERLEVDQHTKHSGKVDSTVEHQLNLKALSEDQLVLLRKFAELAAGGDAGGAEGDAGSEA